VHWTTSRILFEATAIDNSLAAAMEEPLPIHDYDNQGQDNNLSNVSVQIQDGPKIFCDASVCMQQSAANQTGIGIFILTTPSHSLCSASFFSGTYTASNGAATSRGKRSTHGGKTS